MARIAPDVTDHAKRLLVIRQSALGDIVNALYSLGSIRATFPDAHVSWVVDDRFRDLFDAVAGVDEVIVFPRRRWGAWLIRPWRWPRLISEWGRYRRDLGLRTFDLVLDLQGNTKSGWTSSVARAEAIFRFRRKTVPGEDVRPRGLRAEQFLSVAREAGLETVTAPFPWKVPGASVQAVDEHLHRSGLSAGRFAVLHPGSSAFGAYKRWPMDRFTELAVRLSESDVPVLVLWGPGERELAGRIVESARGRRGDIRLAPETAPLSILAALLARAGVFVGNDSGPLHVASACGTPTVGLYGPKDPSIYAPYTSPRAILYHPLPCSPCGKRRCANPECMKALTVDAVYAAARALYQDRADRPFKGTPLRSRSLIQDERLPVDALPPGHGPFRTFVAGSWRWTAVAGEEGPLAAAAMRSRDGLPGDVVQQNPRRTFLRARLPRFGSEGDRSDPGSGRPVFVKVFPLVSAGHRVRAWFGRSQADVEFSRLCRLRAAGAPVPTPLAIGRGPAAQALVLEDFGGVRTLRSLLDGGSDRRARRALLDKTADAVACLHAAGFIHEDLHAGNLLVMDDGSVRVIDFQRGRWARDLSAADRSTSLAHLLLSLGPLADDLEQLRLLRRYAASAKLDSRYWRSLVWTIVADLGILRCRHVRGQIDRARGGGSRIWIGPWKGGGARAAFGAREWLDAPETIEAVVKDEAGRRVLRVVKGGHRLAVKEETRAGRAVRAWEAAHGWLAAGLPTPRPYYLHETPSGPVRLVTEWVEGGESSSRWVERRLQEGASPAWRRLASHALGRLVRRIHDRGVYHADLKAGNVLVREIDGRAPEFHVLDLDRVAFGERAVSRSKAFSNLAQLNAVFIPPVTRTDRLRCYRAYAGRSTGLIRGWKEAVREIMRLTIARRHRWP